MLTSGVGIRVRATGLHGDEAAQGRSQGRRARDYGKAGPAHDYWIKEIRQRETDYVERAEQAYERMVAAWKQARQNARRLPHKDLTRE